LVYYNKKWFYTVSTLYFPSIMALARVTIYFGVRKGVLYMLKYGNAFYEST